MHNFELKLLAQASNYQKWVTDTVRPFLGNRILETGSGTGNISKWLPLRERLILTESSPELLGELETNIRSSFGEDPKISVQSLNFMTDDLSHLSQEQVDTIVSFNVLEHVEDDATALQKLVQLLKSSSSNGPKRIVKFVPAHQWAYGQMDRYYGHYRRYSAKSFSKMVEQVAKGSKATFRYFNLVGLPGWFVAGRILKKSIIEPSSVTLFDRICPAIRGIDDFVHEKLKLPLGQSLLVVIEV